MWAEIVLLTVVVSVVAALIGRGERRRRAWEAAVPAEGSGQPRWIPADPLDATFPVERTRREHTIGDAAFVDGFLVGHHVAGADGRWAGVRSRADRFDPSADGSFDVVVDGADGGDSSSDAPEDLVGDQFDDPSDDPLNDPFGDGWDDDW